MNLNVVLIEAKKPRKRRGRGEGSGLGKSAGRGNKGAKARSGWRRRYGYEGGQMPIVRRVPKRGFNNFNFASYFDVVNVGQLEGSFEDGAKVDRAALIDRGILKPRYEMLKLLGDGELKKKLTIVVHTASESARKKVEAAGGSLSCLLPPRKIHKPFVKRPVVPVAKVAEEPKPKKEKKEKGAAPGAGAAQAPKGKAEPKPVEGKGDAKLAAAAAAAASSKAPGKVAEVPASAKGLARPAKQALAAKPESAAPPG